MDKMDLILTDPYAMDELIFESDLPKIVPPLVKEIPTIIAEPPSFKIVAVQSLAGNEDYFSETHDEPKTPEKKRPKLKIVPISALTSPISIEHGGTKLAETISDDSTSDDENEIQVKRFRADKPGFTSSNLISNRAPNTASESPNADENEGFRPSGSSRRKSRITTRNADFDEPAVMNNAILNAVHEEQVQKARELPQGSKTELELMRNVAFLRVCVNHILTKIGRRPITYDRNNQTLASLIHKYSKS